MHGIHLSRPAPDALRRLCIAASACLLACIAGCDEAPPPTDKVVARPVKLMRVDTGIGEEIRRFPATIEAAQQAALAFRVPGRLAELPIREGDVVSEGQVIARLDPTDYQIALEDRQASFDNASRNYQRAQELVGSGNISRLDFDRMEAEFRSARAALAQARANLGYTELAAPFSGRIAQRMVENFEEVMAKQTVAHLQDTDQLDVIIALPEGVVRSVQTPDQAEVRVTNASDSPASRVMALVSFEDHPEVRYALELKEVATRADPDTQTFRVTFSMPQPDEFTVLPGMTAEVELDFSGILTRSASAWVPSRAVQADAGLAPRVWVLDPETMTVSSRSVTVGRLAGRQIEIVDGLEGGEEIVVAGAAYLGDGMAVTRMESGEQAIPRDSDLAGQP